MFRRLRAGVLVFCVDVLGVYIMLCRMCFARGGAVHRGTKIGMGYRFLVDCICRFCYIEAFVIFGTMIRLRDV